MAQFPHIQSESVVQVNDRTRLDASKSFVSSGSTALSAVTFTPGIGITPIVITSAVNTDWVLDYAYDQSGVLTADVITGVNDEIDFSEGGAQLTAIIAQANYTRTTLASAIKTALDSAGALTYTVSVNADTNKFTIAATGNFEILTKTGTSPSSLLPYIGFTDTSDKEDAASYLADEATESGLKLITIETDDGAVQTTTTRHLEVRTVKGDALFSDDGDLTAHEPDILGYIRSGRNSYLDVHRAAQDRIMGVLDEDGFTDDNNDRLTKSAIVRIDEVADWSKFLALQIIFEGLSNAIDDVFSDKANKYRTLIDNQVRNRAIMRLDTDADGAIDQGEMNQIQTMGVYRR